MMSYRPILALASSLLLAATVAAPLSAQDREIASGVVVDATRGAPLAGVSVAVVDGDRRAFTSATGTFTLALPGEGPHTLRISHLGYQTLEAMAEPGLSMRIELQVDVVGLDPFLVLSERIRMVGDPIGRRAAPGTAHYISRADLNERPLLFDDVHSVLRRVPGVTVIEEEGLGLRPNIGIRGSGTDRNTRITVMEDGILAAPAPYAAPAAYYFPTMGRMEGIEVRKGASQIRFGPRTTGGAINLIPTQIPDRTSLSAELGGGSFGAFKGRAAAGTSGDHWGIVVETYQMSNEGFKKLPAGENTGYRLQDYQLKARVNTARDAALFQSLEFRAGHSDQLSDETYLGLTDSDFGTNPLARYAASHLDNIDADHSSVQLRHFLRSSSGVDLTTIAYRSETARNWYKLQSVMGGGLAAILDHPEDHQDALAVIRGADSAEDAVVVRANNRAYMAEGIQSILGLRFASGSLSHDLEFGVRLHRDHEDRFQWEDRFRMANGALQLTTEGIPGTQANRLGEASAVAFWVQDQVDMGALTVTPGVRFETIDFTSTNWGAADLERETEGTVQRNSAQAWIPGVGAAYNVSSRLGLFGGIHKGFGPPGPGADEATEPEESWNFEFGTRYRQGRFGLELATFFNRYRNILGAETASQGTAGEGNLHNGGAVDARGVELLLQADIASGVDLPFRVPVQATWSYTHSEFRTSFQSGFWGNVTAGDELPYAPKHLFSGSVGLQGERLGLTLTAHGAGTGRTEAGSGSIPANRRTDAFVTFGAAIDWRLPELNAVVFAGLENITDERYVVARVPSGVRPGLPRALQAGVRWNR